MKKGFTLIELLVVVLIIGILSSIALPQYQKAVDKARGAEALTVLNAMEKAQTVYYLENRAFTDNISDLVIELPEMKHFYGSTPGGNPWRLIARKGDAQVLLDRWGSGGKAYFQRYCLGSDCKNYFSCSTISVGCGGSYSRCNL